MAYVAATGADAERALKLIGAADSLYADLAVRRTPAEQQRLESWLQQAREQLGETRADLAVAAGHGLSLDDAVAFALSADEFLEAGHTAGSLLTAREQEVTLLLASGTSNRAIAEALVISPHTAERHVENILG